MNEKQFVLFYDTYFKRITQAYAICGSLPRARRAAEEAFIRAWEVRKALGD